MRHRGRPVTTHQHDSRETEPQRPEQKHELEPIKGQRRSGFCYYVASRPHVSVNIARAIRTVHAGGCPGQYGFTLRARRGCGAACQVFRFPDASEIHRSAHCRVVAVLDLDRSTHEMSASSTMIRLLLGVDGSIGRRNLMLGRA